MRFRHQTQFVTETEGQAGNCLLACLCSLLEVDLESAPLPQTRDEIWSQASEFALSRGYWLVMLAADDTTACGLEDAVLIACGISPRQPFEDRLISHAVLWKDGEVVFDPHPDGNGLDGYPHSFYLLLPDFERKSADRYLEDSCFGYVVNVGDTFAYACADLEMMSDYDWYRIKPVVAEHGYAAFDAYAAVKRNADVIKPKRTADFLAAKTKIEAILRDDDMFMDGDEVVEPVRRWRASDDPIRRQEEQ